MTKTCSTVCLQISLALGACTDVPHGVPTSHVAANKGSCREADSVEISTISLADFFMLHQTGELLLIDARHPWFYKQSRIPGAINVNPDADIDTQVRVLEPQLNKARRQNHPIVVYCNGIGCHDARTVLKAIANRGYDCVKFGGGWKAWKKVDLPVKSASQECINLTTQPAS